MNLYAAINAAAKETCWCPIEKTMDWVQRFYNHVGMPKPKERKSNSQYHVSDRDIHTTIHENMNRTKKNQMFFRTQTKYREGEWS